MPYPGGRWQPAGRPAHRPHEYVRNGTAKSPTLFHPASGEVRVKGATTCTNHVLHAWLRAELTAVPAALPPAPPGDPLATRGAWAGWQAGLARRFTLPEDLPPRAHRSNPRVIKQKLRNFPVQTTADRHWPQPTKPFRTAAVLLI